MIPLPYYRNITYVQDLSTYAKWPVFPGHLSITSTKIYILSELNLSTLRPHPLIGYLIQNPFQ